MIEAFEHLEKALSNFCKIWKSPDTSMGKALFWAALPNSWHNAETRVLSLQNYLSLQSVKASRYIQSGKPRQNAYGERYNRTVRTEWLGRYHFKTIKDVQERAARWLWTYNNKRPNMGIRGMTPIQKLKAA